MGYGRELEVAVEAARAAGALIRAEFHRAGGPRAEGPGHAPVDVEAERLIRASLLQAFPADGYVGEETGSVGRGAVRTWYVDPHDGTRAFLRGHRGSAVSVGLVVDGVPVLGVVYAPTAPDDAGDLITWAEGEALRRNGGEVVRGELPAALEGPSVVAVNTDAAEPAVLARMLALSTPGRVLARASIAYRLALVAVGEADAAVSLGGPTDYDVAGGHALLRAVGGVLLDSGGRPVTYGPAGTWEGNVFGGARPVAELLVRRASEGGTVKLPSGALAAKYPHLQPGNAHKVRDAGLLCRAQGALLGQVAGDALGQLVEFRSRASVFQEYPGGVREMADGGAFRTRAGQPTDDSEMALMLARSIVANGRFDDDQVLAAYRDWLASSPFDVGTTTRTGLDGGDTSGSEANGSLMRLSPLAVHLWRNGPDGVATWAVRDAQLTHQSGVCIEAAAVYASAIALAVREGLPPRALYDRVAAWVRSNALFETAVKDIFEGEDVSPVKDFHTHAGWALVALRNAFHQLLHAPSFEEALVRTVSQGADADTNGAIVGALLGAVHGRDAVPLRWRRAVLTCRAVGGERPRPSPFWADDLLELAERLVATGTVDEEIVAEDLPSEGPVSLDQRRAHKAGEAEARQRLRDAVRGARVELEVLRRAAGQLAVYAGLPMPADGRPDARGVEALTRGLLGARDPEVAAVGQALALLEQVAAGKVGR